MRQIKILHTEWSNGWGGQEIRIVTESKVFIDKGYQVIIAAQPHSKLLKKAQQENIPTFSIKMNKGLNFIAMLKLANFIYKNQIDIVHTHSSIDSRTAGIAAKIMGVAVVRSRHISIPISLRKFTYFQYMKIADKVITSGQFIKNEMVNKNKMIPEKIVSAPAGIDIQQFSLTRNLPDIKEKYNINDKFLIGIVSVLRSWKGHKYLIEAINILKNKIPNIHLIIVGDGPKKNSIEQLIKELDLETYITLTGYQKDPAAFFKAMDIMVLPSYAGEATSQVLPQAMAMKTPIIATHAGGLSEVVIDKETGLVIKPKDSQSIADAIYTLFTNEELKEKISIQGQKYTFKNFTFEKMIQTTEKVYLEVLKK